MHSNDYQYALLLEAITYAWSYKYYEEPNFENMAADMLAYLKSHSYRLTTDKETSFDD